MSEKINATRVLIEKEFNGQKLKLESGRLAPQARASVLATLGETTVLVTVVSVPSEEALDFFPLKVDYEERFYAGGIIGGSRFSRREGKPNDEAIISGRLIDHAIRPLFDKDFMYDTQIIVTVLSIDGTNSPALLGFLAVSAAFTISGLPFAGPIVPMRIQKVDGTITTDLSIPNENAQLDIISSYLEDGKKVQAIEAEGHIIPETEVYEAIKAGAEKSKELFSILNEFTSQFEVEKFDYVKSWLNREAIKEFHATVLPEFEKWSKSGLGYKDPKWDENSKELANALSEKSDGKYSAKQVYILIGEVQKDYVRDLVINKNERLDKRSIDEIRELAAEVGILPRVHGSALFNRGLTQSLSIATLASNSQKYLENTMMGEVTKRYFHHYNFPPYSTAEVGKVGGASRRDIGHGMLAEKALMPVLPSEDEFPYVIRVVSEILSSNGSTSMAATCASSLALMDAGVPIKSHVGGIGVGLFLDSHIENPKLKDYILLTDIVGYEDYAGYMDFKMTGSREGMTAVQLELKLQGIPVELLEAIFDKSKIARHKVIDLMESTIAKPRAELNKYAPKIDFAIIEKDKIGAVIGSGGSVIKGIMEKTGTEIDVEEREKDAIVSISSLSLEKIKEAKGYIVALTTDVEIGDVYEGTVNRIEDYGAFMEVLPKKDGLLHVSEYSYNYVDDIRKHIQVGDKFKVKVIGLDNGKISISKKALDERPEGYVEPERKPRRNDGGRRPFNRR